MAYQLKPISVRVAALRKKYRETKPEICIARYNQVLIKSGPENRGCSARGTSHMASLEFPPETGLILRCTRKAGNPFQTTQGNRLSCRDQEGRRGSDEVVLGPSVFPSREPSVSANFCGRIKGVNYHFALKDGTWDFPGDAGNFGVPLE